jgi:phage shock protein A
MPHFSRLTDIITCSLSEILSQCTDPQQTLQEILAEMQEGLNACSRNIKTSLANQQRLQQEIAAYELQIAEWRTRARQALLEAEEEEARNALRRGMELEDLVAGLRPELEATSSNSRNMSRIQKALGARFSEALRKLEELTGSSSLFPAIPDSLNSQERSAADNSTETLEQKLEALKKDLLK